MNMRARRQGFNPNSSGAWGELGAGRQTKPGPCAIPQGSCGWLRRAGIARLAAVAVEAPDNLAERKTTLCYYHTSLSNQNIFYLNMCQSSRDFIADDVNSWEKCKSQFGMSKSQMFRPAPTQFQDATPHLRTGAPDAWGFATSAPLRGDGPDIIAVYASQTERPDLLWRGIGFASFLGIFLWCLMFVAVQAIAGAFLG